MILFFNKKVRDIVKNDCREYALSFFVLLAVSLTIILSGRLFGLNLNQAGSMWHDAWRLNGVGMVWVGGFLNFTIIFVVFFAGIMGGVRMPSNVRRGITRKEHLLATGTSGLVSCISFYPVFTAINHANNRIFGQSSINYNAFLLVETNFLGSFLILLSVFVLWYFVSLAWQVFGWKISVAAISAVVLIGNFFPISFFSFFTTGGILGASNPVLLFLILLMGVFTFLLSKQLKVKIK